MKTQIICFVWAAIFIINTPAFCQTFNATGGTIPSGPYGADFPIVVTGLSPATIDTSFGIETVCINLTHSYDMEVEIYLISPDSSKILLSYQNGTGANYVNTCFNSGGGSSIAMGNSPFTGTFRPQGELGVINNGQNANGTWRLHIKSLLSSFGTLDNWSITFGNNPAIPLILTSFSSDLPIVIINTHKQEIPDEPKIQAEMGIIYNGPGAVNHINDPLNDYNGSIGIELRGNMAQLAPKKSYGIETRDNQGNDLNVVLLGMPAESDWVLNANYYDETNLKNALTYHLSGQMGHYASRMHHCELFVNNEYKGVYTLGEKIKRDNNRVDIAKLDSNEITGDDVTGGYIIQINDNDSGWYSGILPFMQAITYFQYEYPKWDNIVPAQEAYIQSYVDSFELALYNFPGYPYDYRDYIDVNSFVDFFILQELSANSDAYSRSSYFYKDKNSNGGKIKMGPVWDFDIAWGTFHGGPPVWMYEPKQKPFWWDKLISDTTFTNELQCRWLTLRQNVLDTSTIFSYIDSLVQHIDSAQIRNDSLWEHGNNLSYPTRINNLKNIIIDGITYMDANLPGNCTTFGISETSQTNPKFAVYPNPTEGKFIFETEGMENGILEIYNVLGEKIYKQNILDKKTEVDLLSNPKGIYFVTFYNNKKRYTEKILLQ